jgi:hypothetical protein
MAPRAYVTYYQARGLRGYTSPDGELFLFFDPYALEFFVSYFYQVRTLTILFRNTSGYTSSGKKIFLFGPICNFHRQLQSSSTITVY